MQRLLTSDILRSDGDVDVEQFLDGETVALLVAHHGHVVQAVEVGQRLGVSLVFYELLCAAVQQADVRVGGADRLQHVEALQAACSVPGCQSELVVDLPLRRAPAPGGARRGPRGAAARSSAPCCGLASLRESTHLWGGRHFQYLIFIIFSRWKRQLCLPKFKLPYVFFILLAVSDLMLMID